jgi:hypothetical protein
VHHAAAERLRQHAVVTRLRFLVRVFAQRLTVAGSEEVLAHHVREFVLVEEIDRVALGTALEQHHLDPRACQFGRHHATAGAGTDDTDVDDRAHLHASRSATSSAASSRTAAAAILSCNCRTLLAPMIGTVVRGWLHRYASTMALIADAVALGQFAHCHQLAPVGVGAIQRLHVLADRILASLGQLAEDAATLPRIGNHRHAGCVQFARYPSS